MNETLIIFLAEYLFYFLVLAVVVVWKEQSIDKAIKVGFSISLAFFIASAIKYFFPTERPFTAENLKALVEVGNDLSSFPSTHMSVSSAIAVETFFMDKRLGGLLFIGAVLIGISRVLANVHYPIDILGGLFIGIGVALFLNKLNISIKR